MRLNKSDRQKIKIIRSDALDLRHDEQRRLRNALLALSVLDVSWLSWLERETPRRLPVRPDRLISLTRLVEARTRLVLLKRYQFLRFSMSGIMGRDWPFDDNGNLTPG